MENVYQGGKVYCVWKLLNGKYIATNTKQGNKFDNKFVWIFLKVKKQEKKENSHGDQRKNACGAWKVMCFHIFKEMTPQERKQYYIEFFSYDIVRFSKGFNIFLKILTQRSLKLQNVFKKCYRSN